jgi:uncharacterized membrane protein (DUF2068 family)
MALCILLGISGLFAITMGAFMLSKDATTSAVPAFFIGALLVAAALGLYRMRRWGAALFGLLAAGIPAYFVVSALRQPGRVSLSALPGLLLSLAFLILILYLAVILWGLTR